MRNSFGHAASHIAATRNSEGKQLVQHLVLAKHISSYNLPEVLDSRTGIKCPTWKLMPRSSIPPLHFMMARAGSFPATLVHYFVLGYSQPGDLVFDPFCGKGTTVLQAVLDGRRSLGSDVAPDAVAVSRAKITAISIAELEGYLDAISMENSSLESVPEHVRLFYHDDTLRQLLFIRGVLQSDIGSDNDEKRRPATFLFGCLLGILHGHASYSLSLPCSHTYAMAPEYVRRYTSTHNLQKPTRDVKECLLKKSQLLLRQGSVPQNCASVYESSAEKYAFNGDGCLDDTVDLIVTSPPYLNAQTYSKDAWLRLWLMGYDFRSVQAKYIQTGSVNIYKQRMLPCLYEMLNVLKPESSALLVAGDVIKKVKNKTLRLATAEILAEVALEIEPVRGFVFEVEEIIDDPSPTRTPYHFASFKKKENDEDQNNGLDLRPMSRVVHLRKVPMSARGYP